MDKFNKPSLLYFEGIPLPISPDDIDFVKGKKLKIPIMADEIHDFASKKILSVLAQVQNEQMDLWFNVIIVVLLAVNIALHFVGG